MSNRLPVEVNPFRLIEQRRQLSGVVQMSNLPRLCELLMPGTDTGKFDVELEFMHSPSQLPLISGQVSGQVILECQRCLEPVKVDVNTRLNVVVTASHTDRRPEEEGYELCIIEDERLFLQDFIEDEILLTLPGVPRHEQCEPVRLIREIPDVNDADDEQSAQEESTNPFAVLKDWKKTE